MKKMKYRIAAASMLLALASHALVLAAESTITSVPDTTNIDVQARYQGSSEEVTVYQIDVSWGDMQFTYSETGASTWNPATHEYEEAAQGSWSAQGNTITVINHSNAAVTAQLSFQAASGYEGISGSFSQSTLELATAVGTAVADAPSAVSELTLSGALAESVTDFSTIGQITVSIGSN